MRERRMILWAAVGLAIAGLAARGWHLFTAPLWLDEAYSAYAASKSLHFLWHVVPQYETHPPFYYTLLWVWTRLCGDSLIALRALGLVAGLLTPPAIAWTALACGRWLDWPLQLRRRLALAAFGLACLSIPLVEMTREVRPYPLMILIYAVALRAIVALAERSRWKAPLIGRAYVAYLILTALLLWLHNLGPLWAAALGLALFAAVARRSLKPTDWGWLIAGHLLLLAIYAPAFLILLGQAPTWVKSTWLTFSWTHLTDHLLVLYAVPGWQAIAAFVLMLLGSLALARAPGGRRLLLVLLILAVVPVALSVLISAAIAPVFITRTMTPVAAPTLLLLAIGASGWRKPRAYLALGVAAMLAANMAAVDVQARMGPPMQDWYGTLTWLKKRFRPGDQIYAYPNEGALPLRYAIRDEGLNWPVRPIPADMPAPDVGGWHPTGSRGVISLPRNRLRAIAQEPQTRAVPTIWLLRLGAETYDPGDMFLEELGRDRHEVRRWRDGAIDIIGLAQGSGPIPGLKRKP